MNTAPLPDRRAAAVEFGVVLAAVALAYTLLLSGVQVDDVGRYMDELNRGIYNWDLGHVWMEPIALLLYKGPLQALTVTHALEAVNVASVALGAAVFFQTLRGLGHGLLRCALATALVVGSYNLIVLGPTGHIKLMAFPALALSLQRAVGWEAQAAQGRLRFDHALWSGLWLGVGCNLLVSVLPISVFVGVFMLARARQSGAPWARAWAVSLTYAAGVIGSGGLVLLAAFGMAQLTHSTAASSLGEFLFGGIREKEALHTGFVSWREVPFRFGFSLIFNFVFLPSLGGLGRAWLSGLLADIRPYAASLLWQAALAGLSLACLAAIVWQGILSWRTRAGTLALALGFVLGSAAFSAYYNLNDPEHWFQFTLPLALIATQARKASLDRLVFGLWLPALLLVNLGLYGLPKARFDVEGRRAALHTALGSQGLLVGYGAYPGEPDTSVLYLGDPSTLLQRQALAVRRFNLDHAFERGAQGRVDQVFSLLDAAVDDTLARGGRVLVFRALDESDWRGPISHLAFFGLTHQRLRQHLQARYEVLGASDVAGFPASELKRKAAP